MVHQSQPIQRMQKGILFQFTQQIQNGITSPFLLNNTRWGSFLSNEDFVRLTVAHKNATATATRENFMLYSTVENWN